MSELTFLLSTEAFHSLSEDEARRLLASADRRGFGAGTTIVRKGDPGDAMFVLLTGQVEVRVVGDHERLRFTRYLAPGEIFGEMALLTGLPRTADVVAMEDCTCLVISKSELDARMQEHPPLAAFLSDILGQRILESDALRHVGKYHLLGEIGRGNMSIVFAGYHPDLDRGVAVKMLSYSLVSQPGVREGFAREAQLLASLRHDHIVQVYDLEQAYGTCFIVMERLEGIDLDLWIEEHGRMPADAVRAAIHDVASALAYAHDAGVVHRDVKPANVHRLPDGTCRLMDFGIASQPTGPATDDDLVCSPAFAAPEVIQGAPVDGRADIYSLGVTTFNLLTGGPPFPYEHIPKILRAHLDEPIPDPSQWVPDVPADLHAVIECATQKDPADRFQSASEIVEMLDAGMAAPPGGDRQGTVVTVRYDKGASDRVKTALDDLRNTLDGLPGVETEVRRDDGSS